jgi:hypothetical protein
MPPKQDPEFRQCLTADSAMATWVDLAREYLSQEYISLEEKSRRRTDLVGALESFLTGVTISHAQPRDPGAFLSINHSAPPIEGY